MSTGPSTANSILIVEDDILLATDMEEALKEAGFEVLPPVRTAEEAMRVARHHRPTIALLDIELLGGTNGIELGSQLREELNIPCVFVSGHSDPETVAASTEARPLSWLKKPFAPGSIVASVHLALRQ
jgi:two-component system, response regulator PdtaR